MRNPTTEKLFTNLLKGINEDASNIDALIEDLKELREFARKRQDPLVLKTLRYTFQYLEEHQQFDVDIFEDQDLEEDEEPEEMPEGFTNFTYLITLIADSDNKVNREEIIEYRKILSEYY